MPKAVVITQGGATVTVEGTPEEVAALLERLERLERSDRTESRSSPRQKPRSRATPTGLLADLIAADFFAKPRALGEVKLALEEQGHFYPVTSLSPLMLRLVRTKDLRRIKENKRWLYVA